MEELSIDVRFMHFWKICWVSAAWMAGEDGCFHRLQLVHILGFLSYVADDYMLRV